VTVRLNGTQMAMLWWIAEGHPEGEATNPQRLTARALCTRRLVKIKCRGPRWRAELTDAGRHYLKPGEYPPGIALDLTEAAVRAIFDSLVRRADRL
jgi:hypothetical protein